MTSREMTGKPLFEMFLGALPLATAATLTAAMIFTEGFLSVVGGEWISMFSVKDVITRAWPILPLFLITFPLTYILQTHTIATDKNFLDAPIGMLARAIEKEPNRVRFLIVIVGLLFACFGVLLYFDANNFIGNALGYVLRTYGAGVLVIFGIQCFNLSVVGRIPHFINLSVMWGMTLIVASFAVGSAAGAAVAFSNSNTLLTYGPHRYCGKYIAAVERGVLMYNPAYRSVRLFKWEDVKYLERPVQCALQIKYVSTGIRAMKKANETVGQQ
nr:hypothetical protein [Caulobacter sp. FWC2]